MRIKPASVVCTIKALEKILAEPENHPWEAMFKDEIEHTIRFLEEQLDQHVSGGGNGK